MLQSHNVHRVLQDIILFNAGLRQDMEKGEKIEALMEHWDMLQVNCAAYINSDLPGLPANHQNAPTKPTRSASAWSRVLHTGVRRNKNAKQKICNDLCFAL